MIPLLTRSRQLLNVLVVVLAAGTALLVIGCEEAGPSRTGRISVTSAPSGASIFLDGIDTGQTTPYTIFEVSAGFHAIRLTLDGHTDWGPRGVSVTVGETATVHAPLERTNQPPGPVTPSEDLGLGLKRMDVEAYQSAHILRADPVALPASVDLSVDAPLPRSQGRQGSCVGWAVAFAVKTYHERIERGWPLTDERHVMSPAYVYNQVRVPGGGAYFVDAFNVLIEQGVSSWALMPYDPSDNRSQPSAAARAEAADYKIADWGAVQRTTHAVFVQEVKRHLAAGDPVLIGVPVYPDFHSLSESNPVYDDASGAVSGAHAIVIVGYDDARSAFKIINSWGTDWGIGGYGWIDYDASDSLIWEAYVLEDVVASPDDERPAAPSAPTPGTAAEGVAVDTVLRWTRNARTTSFDVYVGTDRELGAVDFQGNVARAAFTPHLAPGSRYYWRVDARGAGGVTRGPVWSFTTAGATELPGKVVNPSPADGASAVARDTVLSWDSGGHTTSYDVYFGTSPAPELRRTQAGRTFSPGALAAGTLYYWRVDAKNGQGTTTGDVWTFTTGGGSQPGLSIADTSVIEGNSGATDMLFRVTLSEASTQDVTIASIGTKASDGTETGGPPATPQVDYEHTSGNMRFSAGETSKTFRVRVRGDTEVEQDEVFTVHVWNVENATVVDGTAIGTIIDDDARPPPRPVPGSNWKAVYSGTSQGLHDVVWGGGRFVAVGSNGAIVTSPDGITWTAADRVAPRFVALLNVAWGGGRFVAVGNEGSFENEGTVLYSIDGISWTATDSSTSEVFSGVAWGGGRFVVVGRNGTIVTSPDGITWTSTDSGTSRYLLNVAWGAGRFVVVGANGTILTSPDGITWASTDSGISQWLWNVAWSGGRFFALGGAGRVLYSIDGAVWTDASLPVHMILSGVAWNGTRFVAVGCDPPILTSPDGITWTADGDFSDAYCLEAVTWNGVRFVAVGNDGHKSALLISP